MKISDIAYFNPTSSRSARSSKSINYIDTASAFDGSVLTIQHLTSNFPSRAQRRLENGVILISSVRPNLLHNCYIDKAIDDVQSAFDQLEMVEEKYDYQKLPKDL